MALLSYLQQLWQELQIEFSPLYFSLFLLSTLVLIKFLRRTKNKLKLPPAPPKLPIIGNLHQLGSLPHRSLHSLSKRYGPLMLLKLGETPTLVISSAAMAREVMKTHDIVFSNRPQTTAAKILLYGCNNVGFAPYGEYWRQARKVCVLELLSLKRVQSFHYVREEEVLVLVNGLRKGFLDGRSVNLSELIMSTANNIMSRCIIGKKFEDENGKSRYAELSRQLMTQFTAFCFGDFFPYLSWIDVLTGYIGKLKATFEEFDDFFEQMVEEHKVKSSCHQSSEKDFIDILLKLQKDDLFNLIKNENVKGIIQDMLVGGSDTTSTAIEWMMAELIRNPSVMKIAQEEIRGVVGKKSKLDMNEVNEMEYLDCVVKETLRLHPPGPLSVPRQTSTGIKIAGHDIPSQATVFVNIFAIQRDPSLWEKPDDFIPERFLNNPIDFSGQDFQFIPFGGGRRGCPGFTLGVASVKYVMANLLYWFDWKIGDQSVRAEDLNMDETNGLTVFKKLPLYLKPTPYSP